jgi:uncharacterized protein involved in tolerance to divalent cations
MKHSEISRLVIDIFITKVGMADDLEIATDLATTSDDAIGCPNIGWNEGKGVEASRKVTGWDMDQLKAEEEKEYYEKAITYWGDKSSERPVLDEKGSEEELQKEAEWIQWNVVSHLNRCCKNVTVCARSKRWWNKEIAENRNILGLLKRARVRGQATQQQVKKQRSNIRRIILELEINMW